MSDRKIGKGYNNRSRFDAIRFWIGRNCLPAIYWERKFRAISDIHSDDGRSWANELNSAFTWAAYRVSIVVISLAGFLFGFGQLIYKLMGG